MHILLLDETNVEATEINKFFIYGGIFFSVDAALALHRNIIEIREKTGFKSTDIFKFETRSKPSSISKTIFNQAKDNLISACIDNKVLFIVYIVHHKIAKSHSLQKKIEWASSEIINQFDIFLKQESDYGMVMFDRLPSKDNGFQHIVNLFSAGITTATSKSAPHKPTNIIGYSMSTSGASHFASAADIILGAFRYCVNIDENSEVAKKMFPKILKLMYGRIDDKGQKHVGDYGLLMRPHRNLAYGQEYQTLLAKLKKFI